MTRIRLLVGVLALALVAALVAVALLWRDRGDADDRADAAAEAMSASVAAEKSARETVTRMTTYSHRTVEEDFAWVEDAATEKFRQNFDGAQALETVKTVRATAEGEVVDSAASVADPDHVKVLLFVDQRIRSDETRGYKLEQTRLTVQMVRQDGQWLLDEVELTNLLGDPAAR